MQRIIILILLSLCLNGCVRNSQYYMPDGDASFESEAREIAVNAEASMRRKYTLLNEAQILTRLNTISDRLESHMVHNHINPYVYVVATPSYANAGTGGANIYFGNSLISALGTDDRIAYVIAHELAHIDCYHPLRTFKHAARTRWMTYGATQLVNIGLAFVPGISASPLLSVIVPNSVGLFNSVTSHMMHNGYKRSFEYQADQEAIRLMHQAGYDAEAALRALSIIRRLQERSHSRAIHVEVLSTHPVPEKRITRIREVISEYKREKREGSGSGSGDIHG